MLRNTPLISMLFLQLIICFGAYAQGQADRSFAEIAAAAYLLDTAKADPARYTELTRDSRAGLQLLVVERTEDRKIIVGFAGTDFTDTRDLLADVGIVSQEADAFIRTATASLAQEFERLKWIKPGEGNAIAEKMHAGSGVRLDTQRATPHEAASILDFTPANRGRSAGCPGGSFFDLLTGGCWQCPQDKPRRTAYPVTNAKACATPLKPFMLFVGEQLGPATDRGGLCDTGQFVDPRNGGECWSCPAGYGRTPGPPVTSHQACFARTGCPAGQFFDVSSKRCWSCPSGYVRGVVAIDAPQACLAVVESEKASMLIDAGIPVTEKLEAQLSMGRDFLNRILKLADSTGKPISLDRVIVVGHSLGGYIAQLIAAERGVPAVTFNAPGAAKYHAYKSNPADSGLVRNLSRTGDLVGRLGTHIGSLVLLPDVEFDFAKDKGGTTYLYRNHSVSELVQNYPN